MCYKQELNLCVCHTILQRLITWLHKWAIVIKGWKLWLSSPLRSFEHFLISIIPCAVFQHFDCALWNKQAHTNTRTGYCHHLRIIEMCGWHVSSPSLLAGLIRAPLPREHYTHWADIWWLWSTHTHTHSSCCTSSTTQPPRRCTAVLFIFLFFNSSITRQVEKKHPYLVGCNCNTHTLHTKL